MIKRCRRSVFLARIILLSLLCGATPSQLVSAAKNQNDFTANNANRSQQTQLSPKLVSMDYCSDQYILALADRDHIVGLSEDATSVYSFFKKRAAGIPQLRGSSEEILALGPDMVLRHWRGSPQIDVLFERAGIQALTIPFTNSPNAALQTLVDFGDKIGRGEQARAFVSERKAMQTILDTLPSSNLKALYVTPSGYTAGTGTSVTNIITAAGLDTIAEDYALQGWQPLPLEAIAQTKPDLLITSYFELPSPASRWSLSQNPLVNQLLEELPVISLPASMLSCNGLFDIDAATYIRTEASKLGLTAN